MIMKFRKKPVVVEAIQWTGRNASEVIEFAGGRAQQCNHLLVIETLEGGMAAEPGDWVIRGVAGECYPCKPRIFAQTYEPVAAPVEN